MPASVGYLVIDTTDPPYAPGCRMAPVQRRGQVAAELAFWPPRSSLS